MRVPLKSSGKIFLFSHYPKCLIFRTFRVFLFEISSIDIDNRYYAFNKMFVISYKLLYFVGNNKHLSSKRTILLPTNAKLLRNLGENLRLARKRRKLTLEQIAERAGIARSTLWLVEKGDPGVAIGAYIQVLFVLGLEEDISLVAADDELGRKLQDVKFLQNSSVSKLKRATSMKGGATKKAGKMKSSR